LGVDRYGGAWNVPVDQPLKIMSVESGECVRRASAEISA
jgi:hypothetical protein